MCLMERYQILFRGSAHQAVDLEVFVVEHAQVAQPVSGALSPAIQRAWSFVLGN